MKKPVRLALLAAIVAVPVLCVVAACSGGSPAPAPSETASPTVVRYAVQAPEGSKVTFQTASGPRTIETELEGWTTAVAIQPGASTLPAVLVEAPVGSAVSCRLIVSDVPVSNAHATGSAFCPVAKGLTPSEVGF